MVHFPGFARTRLWIRQAVRGFYPRGFPHSEISGSMPACGSPKLIAACHVFHRRLLPRHPPCALSSLTTKFTRCTRAASYQPRARAHASNTQFQIAPSNFMAPACSSRRKDRSTRTKASAPHNLYTPAGNNGTHKNLLRLVICPIYSVVKYRPR